MKSTSSDIDISQVSDEQLPVAKHKLKGWKHFMGLYAGEHVAATEFVFGATFVALGATMTDILLGLLIGNHSGRYHCKYDDIRPVIELGHRVASYFLKIRVQAQTGIYSDRRSDKCPA